MKNKDLKLKMLATATAVVIGGSVVFLSPAQAVLAAEAPVAISTQAILPKMTMAQVYAGLDVRNESEYVTVNQAAFGTAYNHYISNKIGWNLADVSAVTLEGKHIKYKYLQPDILDAWDPQDNKISHTGGDVPAGQPAWYSLRVQLDGPNPNFNAAYWASQVQNDTECTGYVDFVDEGNTMRAVYSYMSPRGYIGYYCEVYDKTNGQVTSFQYEERADLYDDLRALTVVYSCLPQ